MANVGTATIIVKASSVSLPTDLGKANAQIKGFGATAEKDIKKTKDAFANINEKFGVRAGRELLGGEIFKNLASDASFAEKAVGSVNSAVGIFEGTLSKAMRKATAFQALGIGAGIGLAVAAVGWIGALMDKKSKRAEELEKLDEKTKGFIHFAGVTTEDRFTMDAGTHLVTRVAPTVTAADIMHATSAVGIREMGEGARRDTRAAGRSTAEVAVDEAESMVRVGRLVGDVSPVFVAFSREVSSAREALDRLDTSTRLTGFEHAVRGARTATETMGMSAHEADIHGLTMRRVTRDVGGFTIATMESITPLEAHTARTRDLTRALDAGEITAEEFTGRIATSDAALRAETIGLERATAAVLALAGARVEESLVSSSDRAGRRIAEFTSLFDAGVISARSFRASVVGVFDGITGDVRTSTERLDTTLRDIGRAWGLAVASGFEGAVGASLRRASTAAITAVIGDTRTPLETMRERIGEIGAAEDAATAAHARDVRAGIAAGAFDATAFERARAGALTGLMSSVHLDMPAGVEALGMGSVEAARAINAFNRSGPTDPGERAAATLERIERIERERAASDAAMLEALRAGAVGFPGL